MKIGFGTTVLSKNLAINRLDGISIYTQAILNELQKGQIDITTMKFYSKVDTSNESIVLKKHFSYSIHSGLSALCNTPIGNFKKHEKEIDIFFAPDHYIPHLKQTPVVATVMDIIPFVHPEWTSSKMRKLKNFAFKKAILSADHIVTISQYSKNDIMNYFNIKEESISVVTLGVDDNYFKRIEADVKKDVLNKYSIEKDFFIFIGTLQPRKNILRIIDAFYELPSEIKKETELIIVGQDGWRTDELLEKLQKLQKDGYGRWLNYVPQEDIFALLQSSTAMIYPSLYEGFGLPVIEAFASKCPVISSKSTSIPEVAGDAALLVNPYSIEEISDAMYELISDSALRESLIQKGLKQVQKFTWKKSAEQHLKIFKKVLQK